MDQNNAEEKHNRQGDGPVETVWFYQRLANEGLICAQYVNTFGQYLSITFNIYTDGRTNYSGLDPREFVEILNTAEHVCDINLIVLPIEINFVEGKWDPKTGKELKPEIIKTHQNILLCQKQKGRWEIERFEPFGNTYYGWDYINMVLIHLGNALNNNFIFSANEGQFQDWDEDFCQNISLNYAILRKNRPDANKNYLKEEAARQCRL